MRIGIVTILTSAALALAACGGERSADQTGSVCRAVASGTASAAAPSAAPPAARAAPVPAAAGSIAPPSPDMNIDSRNAPVIADLAASMAQRTAGRPAKQYVVLAISAGGQWGAYGAGILVGQQQTAGAPHYDLVTGISTGAMLAPLAFLGDYQQMRQLYTTIGNADIYRQRSALELLTADSLADNAPLKAKLTSIVTDDFVARIAAEGAKGRILAVQSVDLDRGRSVVFDLTAIAQGKYHPCGADVAAPDCIVSAILAAASIPVAFPPTFIKGEMFVDGGLLQAAFMLNVTHRVARHPRDAARAAAPDQDFVLQGGGPQGSDAVSIDLTLLANTDFHTDPQCTPNGFLQIAERAAGIAVDQIAVGSFYRLLTETMGQPNSAARYTFADSRLTQCTLDDSGGILDAFNTPYMQCLYRSACTLAAANDPRIWHTSPDDLPRSPLSRRPRAAAALAPENAPAICQPATIGS